MSSINYDLTKIKAFIFDVDGVLSSSSITLAMDGEPMRMVNIKDGYALNLATHLGYKIAIITGGNSSAIKLRFSRLGIQHIYMNSKNKINDYQDFIDKTGCKSEEIIYVGDDIPDYLVMQQVGLPVAPSDAAPEIKLISKYISHLRGGEGLARDVIEQVLKSQGKWLTADAFGW